MRAAYWLSFALALIPFIVQLVATVVGWVALARVIRRRETMSATTLDRRPVWPLFLFASFAFVLSVWQGVYVDDLFAGYSYDDGVESVEVLGVLIPLELGENVDRFVDSAFSLLLSVGVIILFAVLLFRARKQPAVEARTFRTFRFVMVCVIGFLVWSAWRTLPYRLADLRALF